MSGGTTVFKQVGYSLENLLAYIEQGDIGLPDIQRPFVWPAAKVRDLFDSMYRGFPVGYLLFWDNANGGARTIGTDGKAHAPNRLIVDGQQRLTSLYAVLKGKPIVDSEYRETRLEIAFRPRDGAFAVADAAIRKDPEYIASISDVWRNGTSYKTIGSFIENLRQRREVDVLEEEAIAQNLDRLFDLKNYPFTALEVSSMVSEEQVADIIRTHQQRGREAEAVRLHPDSHVSVLGRRTQGPRDVRSAQSDTERRRLPFAVQPPLAPRARPAAPNRGCCRLPARSS